MPRLRLFAPAIVMGIGCLLLLGVRRQYLAPLAAPLRSIPVTLAGYAGDERDMTDDERRAAGVNDYLFRVFGPDSAAAFSVYVGYYERQATGRSIHSPKNCLPGAGWQTVESGQAIVDVEGRPVTVNRYLLANGASQAMVYYWYQGRGRVAYSEYTVKWDLLRDAVEHGRSEEALVRIVVPVAPIPGFTTEAWHRQVNAAEAVARTVAAELIPRVGRVLPPWSAAGPRAGGS